MAKNWISGAIKNTGALREIADRAGAIKNGTISNAWLEQKAKGNDKTAKRARLAITLKKMNKKK